jgi:hypothetical protein
LLLFAGILRYGGNGADKGGGGRIGADYEEETAAVPEAAAAAATAVAEERKSPPAIGIAGCLRASLVTVALPSKTESVSSRRWRTFVMRLKF